MQVRFGEGRLEKGCGRSTSLAAYSTSTLGPPSGSAKLRCLSQRALGLALGCHSPKVPRNFVADRHLCQGVCLGGSATSVTWRQPPCFPAGQQRSVRTLPDFRYIVMHSALVVGFLIRGGWYEGADGQRLAFLQGVSGAFRYGVFYALDRLLTAVKREAVSAKALASTDQEATVPV